MTPEGFLICHDVPIARVGEMIYGSGEVPIEAGFDGIVKIQRTDEDVFRQETIASFEGKPVTLDHPEDFVTPQNWGALAKGIAQNVRRGSGADDGLLLADLLITDDLAIQEVNDGLREVSCGYEADYEQAEPGKGFQRNIIGNHIALVERGRCGPRCAIGDKETKDMAKPKRTWMDRIRTAFKAKDEAALEEALEEAKTADDDEAEEGKEKSETSDALKVILTRMDAQDKAIAKLVKDSEEEKEKTQTDDDDDENSEKTEDDDDESDGQTTDAAPTSAQWKDAMSRAEILAPGIRLPTMDAKATPKKMRDALCGCKRRALDSAVSGEHADRLRPLLAGHNVKDAACTTVDALFVAASEIVKSANNAHGARTSVTVKDFGGVTTVADINKRNREAWSNRK